HQDRLVLDRGITRHLVRQTDATRLVDARLGRPAADDALQHDLFRVAIGHLVDGLHEFGHLGRRQNTDTGTDAFARPQDHGQLDAAFLRAPFGRNLQAPLLIHAMTEARIVVRRLAMFRLAHLFTGEPKMAFFPTTTHFYPLYPTTSTKIMGSF